MEEGGLLLYLLLYKCIMMYVMGIGEDSSSGQQASEEGNKNRTSEWTF